VVFLLLSANSSRYPDSSLASRVRGARHFDATNTTNDDRGMPRAGIACQIGDMQ
jgi:hypothetical protein